MPVICRKNFSITVAPGYYAYFKCDEASGTTVLNNSVDTFDLTIGVGTTASVAGKIGTALDFGDGVNRSWTDVASTHWLFPGSFTVRFWIKPAATLGNYLILSPASNWYFQWLGTPSNYFEFLVNTDDGNAWVDTAALTLGSWSHVVAWYEAGVGVGIKVNNGAAVTAADTSALDYDATAQLTLLCSHFMGAGFAMDEIAFWNRKLTAAEITTDWNSGNGVTYP